MTIKPVYTALRVLAMVIGLYPLLYFLNGTHYGIRAGKSVALLASAVWNAGFYTHITCGGTALLIGWLQFSRRLRICRPAIHRAIGKVYLIAAGAGGAAGICIALKANGGPLTALGFFLLGVVWLGTSLQAYRLARNGRYMAHWALAVYSYACCFAAVTLRLWLVLLGLWLPFAISYPVVAWLSWLPNLAIAWAIVRRHRQQDAGRGRQPLGKR